MFGPNGCGKSTLINMIAGLVPADAGEMLFDGRPLSGIISATCSRTIAKPCFPGCARSTTSPIRLKLMGIPKLSATSASKNWFPHLGVKIDLALYPYQLSGGQQQLVSIMRAL